MRFLLMLFLLLTVSACRSKDEEEVKIEPKIYPVVNSLAQFYALAGLTTAEPKISTYNYEQGFIFSPAVKGRIIALTAKLPKANNSLRVTVWEYEKKTVLRTEVLNVSTAGINSRKVIDPLFLEKDRKYMITMTTNTFYKRETPSASILIDYPVKAGEIYYGKHYYGSAVGQAIPTTATEPSRFDGDLSFDFQQVD